jgi:hypothetical protein
MTQNLSWQEILQLTGQEFMRQPIDVYVNWWLDCTVWTYVNLWFLPYRMPGLHSDVDKFVSQFTLNGIRSNLCKQH